MLVFTLRKISFDCYPRKSFGSWREKETEIDKRKNLWDETSN